MSGNFSMPFQLTGGAGYKANPTYDEKLRKNSWYRRASAASGQQEEDRRMSAMGDSSAAAQAMANVAAEGQEGQRRGSYATANGGAATAMRKGSVVVASDSDRRDSLFGMEATAGTTMDPNRRPSTSLASDLFHKMKGGSRKGSTA